MKDEQTEALKRFNDMQAKIVAEYVHSSIVEELEKIKTEIEEKEFKLNCATMSDVALKTAYTEVAKLLDKHIAELKGE